MLQNACQGDNQFVDNEWNMYYAFVSVLSNLYVNGGNIVLNLFVSRGAGITVITSFIAQQGYMPNNRKCVYKFEQ